jgi:hypothetical protein
VQTPNIPIASDKPTLQNRITQHLASVAQGRVALLRDQPKHASVLALKRYQSARLRATYADLRAQARFRAGVDFFTQDLYSDRDFTQRDADLLRIVPSIAKLFPLEALAAVEAALHLHALAEQLDAQMCENAAWTTEWTPENYAIAWRAVGQAELRELQLELVQLTGERLDKLVRVPLIGVSLRAMSAPAALAGLTELHGFLLRGFDAFKALGGARDFLQCVRSREQALMRELFAH